MNRASPLALAALVVFNLVPLIGVFAWGWQSFDLIFLYWMENVVIGVFTVLRMLVRPYGHALELVFPLFLAPFFALHYGGFCWGHGTFVVSLFAPDNLQHSTLAATVLQVLSTDIMLYALASLALIQVMDWARDIRHRGLGADGVKDLMVNPYRRIIVLHVTILGAGFALAALDEPTTGLLLLVLVKSAADVWHWRKDNAAELAAESFSFTPAQLEEMREKYPSPQVTVNGEVRTFDSFAALKRSKEFRMAQALLRLVGAAGELKALTAYMDMKIAEEQGSNVDHTSVAGKALPG